MNKKIIFLFLNVLCLILFLSLSGISCFAITTRDYIYNFSSYTSSRGFYNPSNLVDESDITYSYPQGSSPFYITLNGNNVPTSKTEQIKGVFVRYNYIFSYDDYYSPTECPSKPLKLFAYINNSWILINSKYCDPNVEIAGWTDWINITNLSNSWTWNNVSNLDTKFETDKHFVNLGIVQIKISALTYCGDNIIQLNYYEECDDNNFNDGDGCSNNCTIEDSCKSLGLVYQETANEIGISGSDYIVNYTKLYCAINNSFWQIKHGTIPTYNATIPSDCWNFYPRKIQLKIATNPKVPEYSQPYCYNGSEWKTLGNSDYEQWSSGVFYCGGCALSNYNFSYDGDWNSFTGYYKYMTYSSCWLNNLTRTYCTGNPPIDTTGNHNLIYEEAMWWSKGTFCGDGTIQYPNSYGIYESCDDGNNLNTDTCNASCKKTSCGDKIIQTLNGYGLNELCDNGTANTNTACTPPTYGNGCSYCDTSCSLKTITSSQYCGDGTIQSAYGETCDDGNSINHDRCNASCKLETYSSLYCGDGIIFLGSETCDDGNTQIHDGCYSCQKETYLSSYCGDGIIFSDNETCDDGNRVNYDGCSSNCKIEIYLGDYSTGDGSGGGLGDGSGGGGTSSGGSYEVVYLWCGDGIIESSYGETCDDGNTINGDGCSSECKYETRTQGTYCSNGLQCVTGYCVDNVCCNTPCTGSCADCNLPGKSGTCSMPEDDENCSSINCDSYNSYFNISKTCYKKDYATIVSNRCKSVGSCKTISDCNEYYNLTQYTCTGSRIITPGTCTGNIYGNCTQTGYEYDGVAIEANNGLFGEQGNKLSALFQNKNTSYSSKTSVQSYNDNQWHHVVGVYDLYYGNVNLYVDGNQISTTSKTNLALGCTSFGTCFKSTYTDNTNFLIGSVSPYDLGIEHFKGEVDEVAVWNTALDSTQVQSIYNYYTQIWSCGLNPFINISLSKNFNQPTTSYYSLNKQIPVNLTVLNIGATGVIYDYYLANNQLNNDCGKIGIVYNHRADNTACSKGNGGNISCTITLDSNFNTFDNTMVFYGCVNVSGKWYNSSGGYLRINSSCGDLKVSDGEDCDDGLLINFDGCNSTCMWEKIVTGWSEEETNPTMIDVGLNDSVWVNDTISCNGISGGGGCNSSWIAYIATYVGCNDANIEGENKFSCVYDSGAFTCSVKIPNVFSTNLGYYGCVDRGDCTGLEQSNKEFVKVIGCGDGILNSENEECDNGTANSDRPPCGDIDCVESYCNENCKIINTTNNNTQQSCLVHSDCNQTSCCYGATQYMNGSCITNLPEGMNTVSATESDSCLCMLSRTPTKSMNGTCQNSGDYPCWDTQSARCCGNEIGENWSTTTSTNRMLEDILILGYCNNGVWKSREDSTLTYYTLIVSDYVRTAGSAVYTIFRNTVGKSIDIFFNYR
jgi:cysteine-rich repeat protein